MYMSGSLEDPTCPLPYRQLVLSEEKIKSLWDKSLKFPVVFDDISYGDFKHFLATLASPKNVFFEIGDEQGLVCFTDVQPRLSAVLHFVFYDKKIRGKEITLRAILKDVCQMAQLHRVSALVPEDRGAVVKFVLRLGFKPEGWIREAYLRNGMFLNMGLFGLLESELK
jgi:RimJ/RimL family protein N-acetyltransferase